MKAIGHYEIRQVLGRGGMGVVYRAFDPRFERDVAIKVIRASAALDEVAKKRFYREARSVGRLQHENIVVVHDVGEDESSPYLVMELLGGLDLHQLMTTRSLTLEQKLDIAAQICRGLDYAHSQAVIHRDIKPGNIRVLESGRVKILDFGIARLDSETATVTHSSVGTPRYMSPEQIKEEEEIDHRTDIFSFGIVFYELLTGVSPFPGESVTAVMYKVLNVDPDPPVIDHPSLSADVQRVVAKCLAKDPRKRYASFAEVARELQELLDRTRGLTSGHAGAVDPQVTHLPPAGAPPAEGTDTRVPGEAASGVVLPDEATPTIDPSRPDREAPARPSASGIDAARSEVASRVPPPEVHRRSRTPLLVVGVLLVAVVTAGVWLSGRSRNEPVALAIDADTVRAGQAGSVGEEPDATIPERDDVEVGIPALADTDVVHTVPAPAPPDPTVTDSAEVAREEMRKALESVRANVETQRTSLVALIEPLAGLRDDACFAAAYEEVERLRDAADVAAAGGRFDEASASLTRAATAAESIRVRSEVRTRALAARDDAQAARTSVTEHTRATMVAGELAPIDETRERAEEDLAACRFDDAARGYETARGGYAELRAELERRPEPVRLVALAADGVLDRLKSAMRDGDWSGLPEPIVSYYKRQRDVLTKESDIVRVSVERLAPRVSGQSAETQVIVRVDHRQKGTDVLDSVPIDRTWHWRIGDDAASIESVGD